MSGRLEFKELRRRIRAPVKQLVRDLQDAWSAFDYRTRRQLDRDLALRGGIQWQRLPNCPDRLFDAGGARIGDRLFLVGGFQSQAECCEYLNVFDLKTRRWVQRIRARKNTPQSHLAATSDGMRYIYLAAGQLGAECSPAVADVTAYDTQTDTWHDLPSLPAPRYAPTMQLWRGRLHLIGGAAEDRWTPTADHWSLGVGEGRATDAEWRPERPIPVPGMHRCSILVDDALYVLGGQQGDFVAIKGDPDFTCDGRTRETYLSACFRLDDPGSEWHRLADMAIATSHTDYSVLSHQGQIMVLGGQVYKDPETASIRLSDAIQAYDIARDHWSLAGHLPYRAKFPITTKLDGQLFIATGQKGRGDGDSTGPISNETWVATMPNPEPSVWQADESALRGKHIVMMTHDLSRSGGPLLLVETAQRLIRAGARVQLASVSDDVAGWNIAAQHKVPLIPIETAISEARLADVVIANTTSPIMQRWVRRCLEDAPEVAEKLLWWVHEIDVEAFHRPDLKIEMAAMAVFDSHASRDAWAGVTDLPRDTRVCHPGNSDAFVRNAQKPTAPFRAGRATFWSRQTHDLDRNAIRRKLGVAQGDFLMCSIASFEPRKGQQMLTRTVAQLAATTGLPLKLALVGFVNDAQRAAFLTGLSLQERAVITPDRACLTRSDIMALYLGCDALVVNSQGAGNGRGECFGRVTIEAMACTRPVLGTDAGGTAEIIRDGETGYLYPVGEAGQFVLADRIAGLAEDREFGKHLGEAGRRRAAAHFSHDRFFAEFTEALLAISSRRGP